MPLPNVGELCYVVAWDYDSRNGRERLCVDEWILVAKSRGWHTYAIPHKPSETDKRNGTMPGCFTTRLEALRYAWDFEAGCLYDSAMLVFRLYTHVSPQQRRRRMYQLAKLLQEVD